MAETAIKPENQQSNRRPVPESKWTSFLKMLPLWISTNLTSKRSWKLFFRCWLASWVSFLLMIPGPSLRVLGNAGFFAVLGSVMVPANQPVQVFIMMVGILVLGMLFGWGMLSLATKAAIAARNHVLLQHTLQKVQESVANSSNPDALFMLSIFQGDFLDVRSSVVFGCFFGVTVFILALARAYSPSLLFFSVFGTIVADIIACMGPLFPFAYYQFSNTILISLGCYIAIAFVLILFIFPETVNYAYLALISSALSNCKAVIEIQKEVLESAPQNLQPDSPLSMRAATLRAGLIAQFSQLALKSKFLDVEFTWGRWNGDDAKSLEEPLLGIVSRISGIHAFGQILGRAISPTPTDTTESLASSTVSEEANTWGDTYLLRQIVERSIADEKTYSVTLDDIIPRLNEATSELRAAASDSFSSVIAAIDWANSSRYRRCAASEIDGNYTKLDEAIQKLTTNLEAFKSEKRYILLEPFEQFFASTTPKGQPRLPIRSLTVANVFVANLIVLVEVLLVFMHVVLEVSGKRQRSRLWAPKGLRAVWKILTDKDQESSQAIGEDARPEDGPQEVNHRHFRRDPDSRPPTNTFQKVMNSFYVMYRWATTAEALYAFKYTFVSIALWVPSVLKTSAYFYYVEKGVWALIMAQTTLNIYAADQIFNYFARIGGTFVGALYGLAAWYIGAGRGNGNPYGIAASVAVFLLPVVFVRIHVPMQYLPGALLGGVTFTLIVGYSWIDGHLAQVANVGVGWEIGWRRWTLVMIGCAASFILMLFPGRSGRKAVRLQNSSTINSIACLYSLIVEAWIAGTDMSMRYQPNLDKKPTFEISAFSREFRQKLIKLGGQLQALQSRTVMAQWEGNLRGKWPFKQYDRLVKIQSNMMTSLGQLGSALSHLDNDWRISFVHETQVVNPSFITDVMSTFTLVSSSLRTAEPLQEVLHQSLLDRLWYHEHVTVLRRSDNNEGKPQLLDHVRSLEYTYYTAALVAVFQIVEYLSQLHEITKDLCGQVPMEGFNRWHREYDKAHAVL